MNVRRVAVDAILCADDDQIEPTNRRNWLFVLVLVTLTIQSLWHGEAQEPATLVHANGTDSAKIGLPFTIPFFIENPDFTNTLVLVNGISKYTYADVIVRSLEGQEVVRKRITFSPHSQVQIQLADLLNSAERPVSAGSIVILQNTMIQSSAVLGALEITYRGSSHPSFLTEEVAMPNPEGSSVLRGVTDSSDGTPLLALASLSDASQEITVQCQQKNGTIGSQVIKLPASATILTRACTNLSAAHSTDLSSLLEAPKSSNQESTGIELISDSLPGSFAVFGLSSHSNNGGVFYSTVDFIDPKLMLSSKTVFAGIPVGSTVLLPDGKYVPQLAVANFAQKPVQVKVEYSTTSGNSSSVTVVKNIVVAAHTTEFTSFHELQGDPSLTNSFFVTADTAPGNVVSKLVSASTSWPGEIELMGKDEQDFDNGGNHPWSLSGVRESTLLLFNHSKDKQIFNILISGGGMTWSKAYTLQANQTSAINIRDVIQNQIHDDDGKVLPKQLEQGEVNWFTLDRATGKGRLLQSDQNTGLARSYSCGIYIYLCGASMEVGIDSFTAGDTVGFGSVTSNFCRDVSRTCGGGDPTGQGTSYYSWTSNNQSIASISGSNTSRGVNLFGAGPGTAPINWDASGGGCSRTGQHNANVQTPSGVSVVTDIGGFPQACPTTGVYVRQMLMQVIDQNNPPKPITKSNPSVQEAYNPAQPQSSCPGGGSPTPTSCGPTGPTGPPPCTACGPGQFLDTMTVSSNFCGSGIPQASGCGWSQTSTWSACGNSGSNTIWNSPRSTKSNGVTVNGNSSKWPTGTIFH